MAEKLTRLTRVSVNPSTNDGSASGNITLKTTSSGAAPITNAASTTPRSTPRIELSTTRAANGMAPMDSGTMAAFVPMLVPTRRRVRGMIATMSTRNGTDLPTFTMADNTCSMWRTRLIGQSRPSPGSEKNTSAAPTTVPSTIEMTPAIATIHTVSRSAVHSSRNSIVISSTKA